MREELFVFNEEEIELLKTALQCLKQCKEAYHLSKKTLDSVDHISRYFETMLKKHESNEDDLEKKFNEKIKEIFPNAEILFYPLCINCECHPCECNKENG